MSGQDPAEILRERIRSTTAIPIAQMGLMLGNFACCFTVAAGWLGGRASAPTLAVMVVFWALWALLALFGFAESRVDAMVRREMGAPPRRLTGAQRIVAGLFYLQPPAFAVIAALVLVIIRARP